MKEYCQYCEFQNRLESVAPKWLFETEFEVGKECYSVGGVIAPDEAQLDISIVPTPLIHEETFNYQFDINYFPMCGRRIVKGAEEPMTLERFLDMYDGACAIAVIRGEEELCAIQAMDDIRKDLWFAECKYNIVKSFKILPDEYEDGAVYMLIELR